MSVTFLRLIPLLMGFCLFAQNSYTDSEIHSLELMEQKKSIDNKDIDKMLNLITNIRDEKPDLALTHLSKIKQFIDKNQYQKGLVSYCFHIVEIYSARSEEEKAEKILAEVEKQYEGELSEEHEISMQYLWAFTANALREHEKSISIAQKSLKEAKTTFQKGLFNYILSNNYEGQKKHTEALKYALKAVEYFKVLKNDKYLSYSYDVINVIYQELKDFKKAIIYGRKSLAHARKYNKPNTLIHAYSSMAISYRNLDMIDSAEYMFENIISYATKHEMTYTLAQNLLNLGNLYTDLEQYEKAREQYQSSLTISNKDQIPEGIFYNHLNLGATYTSLKKYDLAIQSYDSANLYIKKFEMSKSLYPYIYGGYYDIYFEQRDYKTALEYYKKMDSVNTVIDEEQTTKDLAEIEGKYNTAVKDAQLEKINNEYIVKRNETRILIFIVVAVLLATAFTILFFHYRNKKLRQLYDRNLELMKTMSYFSTAPDIQRTRAEENNPLKKVFEEVLHLMETEKAYQNPDLTVNDVANEISSNQKNVSAAIANYANTNFNNFINFHRITESKRLILSQEYPTLNEIMYASGFNSRTPFYNAFNKFTGMSPKQFKDLSRSHVQEEIDSDEEAVLM